MASAPSPTRKTVIMHREDVLSEVQRRARLRGRNHARRVLHAVLGALREYVPEPVFQRLADQLPADAGAPPPGGPAVATGGCRDLIRDVARRLHVGEPDAAFYARVTFEQLNASCPHGTSPARIAPSLPADMRALVCARAHDPADRHRHVLRTLAPVVATLSLRPEPAPAAPVEAVIAAEARPRRNGRAHSGAGAAPRAAAD
jgi:uncharacterized protein (DUF2267 family)